MKFIKYILVITILSSFLLASIELNSSYIDEIASGDLILSKKIDQNNAIVADHTIMDQIWLNQVPESDIVNAKDTLHIAYGHTSHGSQLITGMNGLTTFKEANGGTDGLYDWHDGPQAGALDIDDYFVSGDLGNPDRTTWAARTRTYLDNTDNSDVNVVMWSWCGQVSSATEQNITTYLDLMNELETDYPNITFVYMTGHLDGSGEDGNLHIRNEQIRSYCKSNNKVLYDFADIESYDLDENYYLNKSANDNCDYDSTGDGSRDSNWALDWQSNNILDGDWYDCSPAHTQAVNGNQKAYAVWWLFTRIAGWQDEQTDPITSSDTSSETSLPSSTSSDTSSEGSTVSNTGSETEMNTDSSTSEISSNSPSNKSLDSTNVNDNSKEVNPFKTSGFFFVMCLVSLILLYKRK